MTDLLLNTDPRAKRPYDLTVERKLGKVRMDPIEVERAILADWKREWSIAPEECEFNCIEYFKFHPKLKDEEITGWAQHMLRYFLLCFPKVDNNPWLIMMLREIERGYWVLGRKIINLIGSKNSGKTNIFAMLDLALVSVNPRYSRCFVSGPYKTAADATIWGRIGTRFSQMQAANPRLFGRARSITGEIIFDESASEAGYIELVTMDKTGKLQGAKSLDPERGMLIMTCDEIAQFPQRAMMDILDNLTGNSNFICFTGCNFKNIEGLEGDLCRPDDKEYGELHIDNDQTWTSSYKSYTIRMDGHQSPNILAGEVLYPYLLTEPVRQDMEDIHGKDGPKYLEQIRSFPNHSMSDFYVTTRDKVRAGGGYDEFVWDGHGYPQTLAFCDPGFGGDPCQIGTFKFGTARIQSLDGTWHSIPIFEASEPIQTIRLHHNMMADAVWLDRLSSVTGRDVLVRMGSNVTFEQQIAVQVGEFLSHRGIPKTHFGFDGSMRASIVHEMNVVLGSSVVPFDFGGKASDRPFANDGTTAAELFSNFVSEMYFSFAAIVQSGQFRGAERVPLAIAQIVRRPWKEQGNKKQIQPKDKFKSENEGHSPNDADVLIGGLELARRLGFQMNVGRRKKTIVNDVTSMLNSLKSFTMFKRKTAAALHS